MSADTNVEATFCFIDIAGYTALTDAHGERAAADLVDQFNALLRTAVEPHGEIHELIGDCAFVIFAHPSAATASLAALYKLIADRPDFPVVRAGLHHGPTLLRGNRYFGSTVNLAARVAARASGGEILCTQEVVDLLSGDGAEIAIEHRGSATLKNLPQAVDLYAIVLSGLTREYAIDPVCKMQVDTKQAAGELHFDRKTYWFCSLSCVEQFARQPKAYV